MKTKILRVVAQAPFHNEYGGLDLLANKQGISYLRMGASGNGYSLYGPLTAEQVAAFHTLSESNYILCPRLKGFKIIESEETK